MWQFVLLAVFQYLGVVIKVVVLCSITTAILLICCFYSYLCFVSFACMLLNAFAFFGNICLLFFIICSVHGQRYLQVRIVNENHFKKSSEPEDSEEEIVEEKMSSDIANDTECSDSEYEWVTDSESEEQES